MSSRKGTHNSGTELEDVIPARGLCWTAEDATLLCIVLVHLHTLLVLGLFLKAILRLGSR